MRRWLKLLLGIIIFAVLAAIAGYIYLFPMGGLEKVAANRLNALLGDKYPFEVTIGNIGGSVLDRLTLDTVVVRFADSLGGRQLFWARQISASYNLRGLIEGEYYFSAVSLDSVYLLLVQDTAGRFGFPATPEKAPTDSVAPLPDFRVDHLLMSNSDVTLIRPVIPSACTT